MLRRKIMIVGLAVAVATVVAVCSYVGYTLLRPRFEIRGNVVNEQGEPINATVVVTEGYAVSLTETRNQVYSIAVADGKFDIATARCSVVGLWFIASDYKSEFRSYSKLSQVPPILQVVLKSNAQRGS
jgi:hypothetical protein